MTKTRLTINNNGNIKVEGEFETVNELFETKNKNEIYDKINELGLKYDPSIQEEEEWI